MVWRLIKPLGEIEAGFWIFVEDGVTLEQAVRQQFFKVLKKFTLFYNLCGQWEAGPVEYSGLLRRASVPLPTEHTNCQRTKSYCMARWRWDQGRLLYFQFNVLRLIAKALLQVEHSPINIYGSDPLRIALEGGTGMPFSPDRYKVWRNYKRVFECSLLATTIDNRLYVSDIAKWLASDEAKDVDDYVFEVVRRFRYPFPAFSDYDSALPVIYPFCAILKYLLANHSEAREKGVLLSDIFELVIGNSCDGTENLDYYAKLKRTNRLPVGDEDRQVREMLIFLSQASLLKVVNKRIYLDLTQNDLLDAEFFTAIASPELTIPSNLRSEDFIALSRLDQTKGAQLTIKSRESVLEDLFTEGKRVRVTHVKIERSPMLRKLFFQHCPTSACDMCCIDLEQRYPWADRLLELHHILPLSSSLALSSSGTSIEDVVPLCPTCHRGVHSYYKTWLNTNLRNDFKDKTEAANVYQIAKQSIVL